MVVKPSGFTLIELMVVVGIVAILVALAIPFYQDYVIKTQIDRAVGELSVYKSAVEERVARSGGVSNSDIGYAPSNITTGNIATDIASFGVDGSGHLQVTLGGNAHPNLHGLVIRYERDVQGNWQCVIDESAMVGTWRERYRPRGC